ncbi:MAG: SURF1 family protein [Anaerolineae bacterium]|nr:SURF1 family protein [Anaerolineae bacterium]
MTKFFIKHWFRHLVIIAGVIFLVNLGFWQLRRLDQRRALNEEIMTGLNSAPVTLTGEPVDPDALHRHRVTVTGTFENDVNMILRTQSYQGRAGNDLFVPLDIKGSDYSVLVNRGWLPFEEFEPEARRAYDVDDELTIEGIAYRSQQPPHSMAPTDPDPATEGWVDAWFRIDIDKIQQQIDRPLLPVYVDALPEEASNTTPPIREEVEDLGEGSHLSYALQWFSFAVILVITYAAFTWQEYKNIQKED